jgi:hypothetical protein
MLRLPSDSRGVCPKEGAMISYYDAVRDKVSTSQWIDISLVRGGCSKMAFTVPPCLC